LLISKTIKVLLPRWLLNQQSDLSEQNLLAIVRNYLTRYPDYRLEYVQDDFAVCSFLVETKTKKRRRKA
jgi:hypothetical protein